MIGQVNIWLALAGSVIGTYLASIFLYRRFSVGDLVFACITVFIWIFRVVLPSLPALISTITQELLLLSARLSDWPVACAKIELEDSSTNRESLTATEWYSTFWFLPFLQLLHQPYWQVLVRIQFQLRLLQVDLSVSLLHSVPTNSHQEVLRLKEDTSWSDGW